MIHKWNGISGQGRQLATPTILAVILSFALPAGSWASITNTASITYQDAAGTNYNGTASCTPIMTIPVITPPSAITLDVGVAMTPVTVSATESPTLWTLTSGPAGISINNSGVISGTPAASSANSYTANLKAHNAAGDSAMVPVTIVVRGAAHIALTKSADKTSAAPTTVVTFTIAYTNDGSGTASSVLITDVIPTGSTYVNGSAKLNGAPGGAFNSTTRTLTWSVPTVNVGASGNVTFQVTVN